MIIPGGCGTLLRDDRRSRICGGGCIKRIRIGTHISSLVYACYPVTIGGAGCQTGNGVAQRGDIGRHITPTVLCLLLQNKILSIGSRYIIPGKGQFGGKRHRRQTGHLIGAYIVYHVLRYFRCAGIAFGIIHSQTNIHHGNICVKIHCKPDRQSAIVGCTDFFPAISVQRIFVVTPVNAHIILCYRSKCGSACQNSIFSRRHLQHHGSCNIHKRSGACDDRRLTLGAVGTHTCHIIGVGYAFFYRDILEGYRISANNGLNQRILRLALCRAINAVGVGSNLAGASPGKQYLAVIRNGADIDDGFGNHFIGHRKGEGDCTYKTVNTFYRNRTNTHTIVCAVSNLQFGGGIQPLTLIGNIHLRLQGFTFIKSLCIFQGNICLVYGGAF